MAAVNPLSTQQLQALLGNPSTVGFSNGFNPSLAGGGNPYTSGYVGYQGFGPTPFSFSYGPYGWGSYGFEPGTANQGYDQPPMGNFFDTVGRSAKSFALT